MIEIKSKGVLLEKLSAGAGDRRPPFRCRIKGESFEGLNFTDLDLSLSDFIKCKFSNCIFLRAVLRGANFHSAVFGNCSFSNTDLSFANMGRTLCVGTVFEDVSMHFADAHDSCFARSKFVDVKGEGANFDDVIMQNCQTGHCNMRGSSMRSANIEKCTWLNTDLSAAHFEGAVWKGCRVEGCDLSFAVLRESEMRKCVFDTNIYCGADLTGVAGISSEMANNVLAGNGVIRPTLLQKLWRMRYGKFAVLFLMATLIVGSAELVFDQRLETTDVILKKASEAVTKNQLGEADRLLSIAGHRNLLIYQIAWLKKTTGDLLKRKGDRKGAMMNYADAKALSNSGFSLDARAEIAYLYSEEGRYGEAAREFESLLSVIPAWESERDIWTRIIMLEKWIEWGRYSEAERMFEDVRKIKGIQPEQIIEARIRMAGLKGRMGDHRGEVRLYEKLLSEGQANKSQHGCLLWMAGSAYRAIGDRVKAKERYEEAKAWPNVESGLAARFDIATMYWEDKKYEESIREYKGILKMGLSLDADQNARARLEMGDVYAQWGRRDDAALMYKSIERISRAGPERIKEARRRMAELTRGDRR